MPLSILEAETCDEILAALDAGADVLETDLNGENVLHKLIFDAESSCVEDLFAAVDDDDTKRSLLSEKNIAGFTPFGLAFELPDDSFPFLTESAAALEILSQLISKHKKLSKGV